MKPEITIKAEKVKTALWTKLSDNQRSFAWFWKNKLDKCDILYPSFMNMLNGYGKIRADVEEAINEYLGEETPRF